MRRFILVLSLVGCGGGLPAEDVNNVVNAAKTSGAAYKYEDAGTPQAALIRATHCSVQAVIRDQKLTPVDSGIECPR